MTTRRLLAATAIIVTSSGASYAGPCSEEIDHIQAKIDARLEASAAAGSSAAEGTAATLQSADAKLYRSAEGKLGELPSDRATAVFAAMGRAREADRVGDRSGCEEALREVQHILGD
jgi:hypothetical protein